MVEKATSLQSPERAKQLYTKFQKQYRPFRAFLHVVLFTQGIALG